MHACVSPTLTRPALLPRIDNSQSTLNKFRSFVFRCVCAARRPFPAKTPHSTSASLLRARERQDFSAEAEEKFQKVGP